MATVNTIAMYDAKGNQFWVNNTPADVEYMKTKKGLMLSPPKVGGPKPEPADSVLSAPKAKPAGPAKPKPVETE